MKDIQIRKEMKMSYFADYLIMYIGRKPYLIYKNTTRINQ